MMAGVVTAAAAQDTDLDELLGPTESAPTSQSAPAEAPAAADAAPAAATAEPAANAEAPVAVTAEAAPTEAVTTKPKRKSALLEEIVVTAQKREESLSEVPISIQAFSPDALAARGIDNQIGLSRAVPSLNVGSQAGYATIFLRGIGTEAFLTADPSIASYVDGVYFPFSPTFVSDFSGVERVEVLKGPQGTLFGRNAVGGAISVTSIAPSFEDRRTDIDLTVGNFGLVKPRVYANFPITSTFAANFSSYYAVSDSYLDSDSRTDGKPLRKQYDEGVRVRTRWQPFEQFEFLTGFTRTRNQNNGAIGQNINPSPLGRLLGIQPPDDPDNIQVNTRLYGRSETSLISTQANFYAPWLDIKVLASKQKDSLLYNYDFDGSTKPLVSFDVPGHPANIKQAELQLISNESQPYAKWLDVTGGVFLFHNIQGFNPVQLEVGDIVTPPEVQDLVDALLPDGLPGATVAGQLLAPGRAYRVQAEAQIKTISAGYYLQTTMRFTDWVALTLGARYQREDRGLHKSTVNLLVGTTDIGNQILNGPPISFQNARDGAGNIIPGRSVTTGFEPKVTLDFHPFLDETLLFASYQTAKKAHAYNAFAVYLPPQYIKPEDTTAYEVGLRTPLFDGLVQFNLAAFYYRIKNQQTQYVSLLSGGALAFENAPRSESKGIDFDLVTSILPDLIDGLGLSLNGAFIDAKFLRYPNAAGYDPRTGLFRANNDFTGNRQTRTPKFSGTVAVTKLWQLGDRNEVEAGADYYYNSGFYYSASNDPNYEQTKYGQLGAFTRYKYVPWNVDVRLYGKNLLDKFYTQGVISTDFGGVFSIAAPREFGAVLSWKF
ncbi:TonB-dependent receptor [Nevskia ramosa]|uniref:TonB-dependent receptor n=1 Tax=Nevskia ramosa TaxID=64002 RepID=UPI0023571CE2|nr:TonB-dependent receptor [Nevskia ramosa]